MLKISLPIGNFLFFLFFLFYTLNFASTETTRDITRMYVHIDRSCWVEVQCIRTVTLPCSVLKLHVLPLDNFYSSTIFYCSGWKHKKVTGQKFFLKGWIQKAQSYMFGMRNNLDELVCHRAHNLFEWCRNYSSFFSKWPNLIFIIQFWVWSFPVTD